MQQCTSVESKVLDSSFLVFRYLQLQMRSRNLQFVQVAVMQICMAVMLPYQQLQHLQYLEFV